jgi:hypothetical protein
MAVDKQASIRELAETRTWDDRLLADLAAKVSPDSNARTVLELSQHELAVLVLALAGAAATATKQDMPELTHVFLCEANRVYRSLTLARTTL